MKHLSSVLESVLASFPKSPNILGDLVELSRMITYAIKNNIDFTDDQKDEYLITGIAPQWWGEQR
jgi:hypothetical protein